MKLQKGFTLIELLVVISIIGLLSSVVLASLNTARGKARDAERLSDLRALQTALELYRSTHGSYPAIAGGMWWGNCEFTAAWGEGGHPTSGATGWIPNLAPTFIPELPVDPRPRTGGVCYIYRSDGRNYGILANGTVETYTEATNPSPRPRWDGDTSNCGGVDNGYAANFMVYMGAGECW